MQFSEREKNYRNYLTNKVNPIMEPLMKQLLKVQPTDVHEFIIDFVLKHKQDPNFWHQDQTARGDTMARSQVKSPDRSYGGSENYSQNRNSDRKAAQKPVQHAESDQSGSEEDGDDEVMDDIPLAEIQSKKSRSSVSAEAYGKHNKKGDFKPRVIKKTADQRKRIVERLGKAFMFSTLDAREQEIIVDAMEEKKFRKDEWVIKQGDDGDNLYVVDHGTLECYKQFQKNGEPKHVKTYNPGESFGELALLYNAPRAASIKAVTESILFALDRDTFNNIVKDAIIKRREAFEKTLSKIELLDTMDPYERSKIADVAIPLKFKPGEFVIRQGEQGDKFFFIEEGNAVATKTMPGRKEPEEVYNYGPGDYFGELALLKGEPRAANVMAKNNLSLLALDRVSFTRLIGPLNDILKRNMKRYEKFM